MKIRYALLALVPACFALSNLSAFANALENPTNSPELATEGRAPIAIERSIKVPWLNVPKEALPDMSESSAVRMACGVGNISMFSRFKVAKNVSSPALVVRTYAWPSPDRNGVPATVQQVLPVQVAQPVRPVFVPAASLLP
jgi:hypothetical protein